MKTAIRAICFTMLLSAFSFRAAAEDFTNAIHAYLQQRIEAEIRLTKLNRPCSQNIKSKFRSIIHWSFSS
jgi:hypothetical protein